MGYSKKIDIFYIWTGRVMDEFDDFFLPSRGTYIPEKKIKQPTSSPWFPPTFLREIVSADVRCLRSDGWMRVKLNNTSSIMNGATKTHKHLGFTPKNPSFSRKKTWAGRLRDRKDGKNPLPTHKQKHIWRIVVFLELERHLWKFMRWFGVFGDVGKLLSFWGVARFFFLKLANSVFFFVLSFWVVVKNPDAIWELRPIFTWTGSLERTTTLIDDLWWFEGCCLSTWRGPWGPGCLEKPLGDFEEKTPQQVLTSALIPSGTWKFIQEVPSWEESESLLKGSFRGASQEK